ncbi:MAG: deaminated glutathione amidase, partial [Pseudonocardiales bacterium]|nr:deaminated glutathione amidase [Pseudonocardiales bacterium]
MRIALAQIVSTPDPGHNLGLVEEQIRAAAASGARLVVFPEATMCCFGVSLAPVAEPLDGPWASRVRELAADAGLTVVAGMFTPADDGRVRNTLLATGGGVEAAYDKIHLFDAFGFAESDTVAPGTEPVTVDVDGLTVGLTTCYDLRFPGLFQ